MLDVFTLGTATRDVFLTSDSFKVLKDLKHLEKIGFPKGEAACFALGSKIEVQKPFLGMGGGAVNAAVTFARQDLSTAAFIKIGKDEAGNSIVSNLKKEGIKTYVSVSQKSGTGYSSILLTEGGERTILIYRGANDEINEKDFSLSQISAKWVYISPGNISFILMQKFFDICKKKNIKIAFNPSRGYLTLHANVLKSFLKQVDVLLVNREEASYVTGVPYRNETKLVSSFFGLIEKGVAVMTEDTKGAVASDGRYIYRVPVFSNIKTIDETGAGDAFGAGFVSGLIQKKDMLYALRLAAANAGSVVEHVGASTGALTKKTFLQSRWKEISLDIEEI